VKPSDKDRFCACGCGTKLSEWTQWAYIKGHKVAAMRGKKPPTTRHQRLPASLKPREGGLPALRMETLSIDEFELRYCKRRYNDPRVAELLDLISKAPLPFTGEIHVPAHKSVKGLRDALTRRFKDEQKWRVRVYQSKADPQKLGVLKEVRA